MSSPTYLDQLHMLHAALHLSHVPSSLPCREQQAETLRVFLRTHLLGGKGGSLYVSGSPGTGKTASVEHAVQQLCGKRITEGSGAVVAESVVHDPSQPKSRTQLLSKLHSVAKSSSASPSSSSSSSSSRSGPTLLYTNAMSVASNPRGLYPKLLGQYRQRELGAGEEADQNLPGPVECLQQLEKLFCPDVPVPKQQDGSGAGMTLIVLDEVDALLKGPNGAVLYHLLEWPHRPHSRVVVVAISNSINLLEQKLPELARRKAMPIHLVFTTYSADQLKTIAKERCDSIYQADTQQKLLGEVGTSKTTAAQSSSASISTSRSSSSSSTTPTRSLRSSRKRKPDQDEEALMSSSSSKVAPLLPVMEEDEENVEPTEGGQCTTPKKRRKEESGHTQPTAAPSPFSSSSFSAAPPAPLVLIEPSTPTTPIFTDSALDLLCLKVSKSSGDLRKVLEVMRKCVDGLMVEVETIQIMAKNERMKEEEEERKESGSKQTVRPPLQVSLPLLHGMVVSCMGSMGEQHALLRSLPVQQKVLLCIAALLCHLQGGKEQLQNFPKYYARFSQHFQLEPLRGTDFADLLASLAAHRLIKLEKPPPTRRSRVSNGSGSSLVSSGGGGGSRGKRSGAGRGASGSGSSASSATLGGIQVNVTLESLTAAFDGDALMERLLKKGKALATSMLAANRAGSELKQEFASRDIEDLQ